MSAFLALDAKHRDMCTQRRGAAVSPQADGFRCMKDHIPKEISHVGNKFVAAVGNDVAPQVHHGRHVPTVVRETSWPSVCIKHVVCNLEVIGTSVPFVYAPHASNFITYRHSDVLIGENQIPHAFNDVAMSSSRFLKA